MCFQYFLETTKLAELTLLLTDMVEGKIKNMVWHSHNFLLPYSTVEEYFIMRILFIFNLHFPCFAVDELPVFIVIVNIFLNIISVLC